MGPYKSWRNTLEQLFYQLDTPELRENAHLGEFQAAVLNSPKLAYRPNHIPAEWKSALKSDNPGSDRAALTLLVELVDSFIMAIAHHALPSFTKDNPEFTVAEPSAIRAAIERLECCGLVHLTEWASADGNRSVYIFNLTAKALVPLLKPGL